MDKIILANPLAEKMFETERSLEWLDELEKRILDIDAGRVVSLDREAAIDAIVKRLCD